VHSISLPLADAGITPLTCALTITACAFLVILGGIKRVARVASTIVPLKALLYLGTTLIILALHIEHVIPALKLMLHSAFDFSAVGGGIAGFTVLQAITSGFDRGLFATDAGTGIVPILQASARSSNPVTDGVATLIAPFLVMIVCTMTGLVLIVTGAINQGLQSTSMVTYALEHGLHSSLGFYVVIVCLLLFAYTTIIAWSYCGQKAMGFLWPKGAKLFQFCYIAAIPIGAFMHVDIIWGLADIFISLMLIFNVIGVAGLSSQVIRDSRHYFAERKLEMSRST
jgi:alanine or glycine:cation symporter, AGCS family